MPQTTTTIPVGTQMIFNYPAIHAGAPLLFYFATCIVAGLAGGALAYVLLWGTMTARTMHRARAVEAPTQLDAQRANRSRAVAGKR